MQLLTIHFACRAQTLIMESARRNAKDTAFKVESNWSGYPGRKQELLHRSLEWIGCWDVGRRQRKELNQCKETMKASEITKGLKLETFLRTEHRQVRCFHHAHPNEMKRHHKKAVFLCKYLIFKIDICSLYIYIYNNIFFHLKFIG